jgi:alcohol dehydrogenase YqhD (iron-dependent ADH family)
MAPVGTIHTISAAGSETSASSVLVDDVGGTFFKKSFMWPACRPRFAIMNPELTYTLPAFQTGAGAADILAHTAMRYFTDADSYLGDKYCEATFHTVIKYGPVAVAKPDDYEARAELMLAASFSHNDLTGVGRSSAHRGGEHRLEAQLSGHYDTAHGAGLAVVMPAWLQYAADHGGPARLARVARFAVNVFGVEADPADPKAVADEGLNRFRAWIRSLGMPLSLKELGVPKEDLPDVIDRCVADSGDPIRGFIDMDRAAVAAIFGSVVE